MHVSEETYIAGHGIQVDRCCRDLQAEPLAGTSIVSVGASLQSDATSL